MSRGQGDPPSRTIPVIRSTFAVPALAREVARAYGLKDVRLQLIKGTFRDTYRLDSATGPGILSVYRHGIRTEAEIRAELDLLAYLDAHGVPVAPALPQRDGDLLLSLAAPEGVRFVAMFRYVEGHQLSKTPDSSTVLAYGRAVAQIHIATDALPHPLARPRITTRDLLVHSIDALEVLPVASPDHVVELRQAARILQPMLDRLPTSAPAYGLVHGDIIPSNAQVRQDGTVSVLDFDFCGYGWRALDIATYLSEVAYWETPASAREAFMAGYASVRPLSLDEEASLPALEATRAIASLGTPAREVNIWGSAYLSDAMIERTLAIVRERLAQLG